MSLLRPFPALAALASAAALALFAAAPALAQDPSAPAGCGTSTLSSQLITAVSSTETSITATFGGATDGFAGGVQICDAAGTTAYVYGSSGGANNPAGGTHTYTKFGQGDAAPALTVGTDYWLRWNSYGNAQPWVYIRTAGTRASVSLALNSAGDDNTYHNGDAIEITATFAENVTVGTTGGTPRIPFTIGTTERHATYASGSGGTALVFSYTVQTADVDSDGITVAANALELNSGTINLTAGGTAAALDHGAVSASTSHKVDGGAATISKVAFTNQPTGDYGTIGSDVEVTVTFDRPVTVTGTPRIELNPPLGPNDEIRYARYDTGSGDKALVFKYTLVEGDSGGGTLLNVGANKLTLPAGAAIRTGTADATLTHTGASSGKLVSALRPSVDVAVSNSPTVDADLNGTAETFTAASGNNEITVFVDFNNSGLGGMAVDTKGSNANVQIVVTVGSADFTLNYLRTAVGEVVFGTHTVLATHADTDGIAVKRDASGNVIRLSNGATVKNSAESGGNTANLGASADLGVRVGTRSGPPALVRGASSVPLAQASAVQTATGADYTFKLADFKFSDAHNDLLKEIGIEGPPAGTAGRLTLSDTAVVANHLISRSDISSSKLKFEPVATFEGTASFNFWVVDAYDESDPVNTNTMTVRVGASVGLALNSAGDDNTYHNGDTIQVTATFGESVTVTGTPRIPFNLGGATKHANFLRGSPGTDLVFGYEVQSGDSDDDGIEIAANALELNSGTINLTTGGTAAAHDHPAVAASTSHKVDGAAASVSSVEFTNQPTDHYAAIGGEIEVTVTFDRPVTVTGTPRIRLSPTWGPVGTPSRYAEYESGSGTTKLVFKYTLVEGDDSGSTNLSVPSNALELNGGTINTGALNATLTHSAALSGKTVSVKRPTISAAATVGSPGVDANQDGMTDTFVAGATFGVAVTFDQAMAVDTKGDNANAKIVVDIGGTEVTLNYIAHTGTHVRFGTHTVAASDRDDDGITIKRDGSNNVIRLAGGATVKGAAAAGGNSAVLTAAADPQVGTEDDSNIRARVRGTNTAPTTSNFAVTTATDTDYTFRIENFPISDSDGDAVHIVEITGLPTGTHGALTLADTTFTVPHTVARADIEASKLKFEPASGFTGDATFNFKVVDPFGTTSASAATMTVRVGASVALSLNSAGDDNTYHNGDTIQVTAAFGESVTVTGTPRIAMTVGSNTRHANYRRGSPGQSLVFSYVVQTADVDPDGIEIAANALALNGGTINLTTNTATAANRDHEAVAASTSHKVDGAAASISSVAFTNQPTGTYRTIGGDIEVTVTFDRPVTVTGTPRIPLSPAFGPSNAVRFADYDSGTGTKNLVFKYTLVEGDDSDGTQASVAANALELNGGTIRTGSEAAALAHVQVSSGKTVSAKRPKINAITVSPGPGVDRDLNGAADTYVGGSDINVTVGFDQNIDVDRMGQDSHVQIVLTIGTTDYALAYSGRSGSAGITFAGHTVDTTDRDDDGITLKRQSATNHVIRLSGTPSAATIKSVAALGGNDADLTLATDPKVTWTPAGEDPVTSLNVRGTNAAPTSSASRVATATDTDYTFRVADFTFSDSESDPLKEVQIVSLPTSGQGALTLSGTAVTAGQTVSRSDITNLVFDPVATFEGDASFTFKAVDSFGAASTAAATMTVAVGASVSLSFNSAGADNAYHTNDAIEITAMFGESVTVGTTGGRPRIPFTIGTTVRHAVYASGSGSTALVFSYTVVAADLDADGIEVAENALELNSGTINLTSNTATAAALDHAAVPANAARKVNVAKPAAPAAPSVSTTDGTTLIVTWTAPANTRPDITDYDVEYRRKNVPGGDPTDWTDASHTGTALADTITGLVRGASYEARVRATNSEGASDWSAAGAGHTGPARVVSAATNTAGTAVIITLTKRITGSPGVIGNFSYLINQGVGFAGGSPHAAATDEGLVGVIFRPDHQAMHGQTVTVSYTNPGSGPRLRDPDLLFVASFSNVAVTNNVPAPVPVVTKATLQGTSLKITFSRALNGGAIPQASAFTVKLGTTAQALRTASPVSITGSVVTLVLNAAPGAGAVTVDYTKPATGVKLVGAGTGGMEVATFTGQAVIRPATVRSATTNETGRQVTITFNKNLGAQAVHHNTFRVVIGGTERTPTRLAKRDSVVQLALSAAHRITPGQTVTVKYTKPAVNKLRDADGLEVESFSGQSVTNIVPTVFQSAETNSSGDFVIITFTSALTSNGSVEASAYTIAVDGADRNPSSTSVVSQGRLALVLSGAAITAGQTVTVSYAKPATGNKLTDAASREIDSFTDQPVTNEVPATITQVAITSDPGPDRIYQRDDVIRVTVTFNAPVTVDRTGGTPYLVMHFRRGGFPQQRDKQAAYTTGTGTNMLVFAYTVTSADNSAHEGIGLPANMLELNNGTIRTGSTDATLTYADVHHDDANHRVHGPTAQDVTGPAVSTATVNGASLVITFNEALDATGTAPAASAFTVKVGGTAVDLADTTPVAISGSAVTLTLAAAVIDADVVTVAYAKPSANPIQDFTAGNDAPSFGDTDVTNNTPDLAPTVLTDPAPVVGGTRLVITFSEPLWDAAHGIPATSAFTVLVAGNNRGVSNVTVSGATVILTLESAAVFGESVTVSYTQPAVTEPRLQDRVDPTPNPVASFGPLSVTNNDNTAPSFSTAAVDGAALTLTFDENLDATSEPAASAFTVQVAGAGRTVSGVSLSAATVTLTLASAVTPGQGVTVSYAQPTANPLQDGATNKVANFGPETATNNTRAAVVGLPAATSSPASGDTYGLGEHIEVTVTFSHPVTVTGTPQLELTVGTNNRQAAFLRGGGTTALVFRYTVVAADADADGISVGANKLTLPAGAAIQDAGNGAATLTHTALGAQTGHKVDGTLVRTAVTIAGGGPVAEGGNATFTLTASPAPSADITVNLGVSQSGNYVADADLGSKTVTVPTTGTATYTVPTVNDATDEPNGSVTVTVQAGAGYNVGAPDAASVTVNDNDAAPPPPPPTPTRPAFSRAAVNGTALTITFNRNLDTGSAPAGSAFTVTATPSGGSARSIPGTGTASIAGATVTVTLASAVAPGETVRVAYARPSANPLRGAGSTGREVANFSGRSVTNSTAGPSAPPPQGGRVSDGGATVTLNFADELDASSTPDPGDFTITVAAASDAGSGAASPAADDHYRVTAVSILGATVELTISPQIPAGREATVSYTPGTRPLRTAAGAPVPTFSVDVAVPPAPAEPTVTVEGGSALEGSRVTFTVRLSSAVDADVVLGWSTGRDGSPGAQQARADLDYISVRDGRVTIPAGSTEATFSVAIAADDEGEGDETFIVTITGIDLPEGVTVGVASAVGTIEDDTPPEPPVTPVTDSVTVEGGSAKEGSPVVFTARLSSTVRADVVLRWFTSPDWTPGASRATAGEDYTAVRNGSVRIAAGTTAATFEVETVADTVEEADETFRVNIDEVVLPPGVGIVRATALGTIENYTPPPPPPPNDPPVFEAPEYAFELRENVDGSAEPVALGAVSAADPDGDTLSYELASGDASRFAVGAADGAVSYVGPGEDFEAEPNVYELTVRASDPAGASAEALVTVTVVNENELPEAADDAASTDEDVAVTVDVLANDTDPDGDSLRVASVTTPENGTTEVTADGGVRYTPAENWHGTDAFTYEIDDGNGGTASASVSVTVAPVNDLPEAAADSASTAEDSAVVVDVLANDTDIDGDSLRVASVSAPANGTAAIAAGGVLYTPGANWHGTDSFTYEIDDGNGGTASASVEVTVAPMNDVPEAVDDEASTVEDEAVTVDVLSNDTDPDGDGLRVASVSAPENGTAEVTAGGVLYTPAANWHGTDRFTYEVEDGQGGTASAAVEVTVAPANDGPVAVGTIPAQSLEEGGELARVELSPFFEDPDGDALTYGVASSDSSVVRATVSGSVLMLTPVSYGSVVVAVAAWDAAGLAAQQAVAIRVSDGAARGMVSHALAGMARSHLASARMTLGRRPMASRSEASRLSLMGRDVPLSLGAAKSAAEQRWQGWLSGITSRAMSYARPDSGSTGSPGSPGDDPTLGDLFRFEDLVGDLTRFEGGQDPLRGSEFQFGFDVGGAQEAGRGGGGGLRFQLWGQGDVQTFRGAPSDGNDYDGELQTGYVGLDTWLGSRFMLGVAVARSQGTGDWRTGATSGALQTRLVAVHPYLQWTSGATSIWAMAGAGRGDADNVRDGNGLAETSDLGLRMGLVELRRRLAASGGFSLALRADAGWAELQTETGSETLDGQTAAVDQLRFGAELSQQIRLGGLTLNPFGEAHVRRDGGAGQPGTGLELIGGLKAKAGFLRIDAQGRMLAIHSATGYEEQGFSATLSLGSQGGTGPSLSVSPRWGDLASGGGDALWQEQVYTRHAPPAAAPSADGAPAPHACGPWALDVSGNYGIRLPGDRLLTWSATVNHSPLGPRYTTALQLSFAGSPKARPETPPLP